MSGPSGPLTAFNVLKSSSRATDAEDVESVPTLIVVPARAENAEEIEPLLQTLVSVTATAPDAMVLVVDDRSPAPLAQMIEVAAAELDCAYVLQQDGEGRLAAFNVGLSVAAEHGMDVCFVASGLVLDSPRWLDRLRARTGTDGEPAAVVGGAVVHAAGTIRQAGYFFSRFRRAWRARLRNVPAVLLDVDQPLLCPVSSELQFDPQGVDRPRRRSTTSSSKGRTRRSTTASASARPAGSACSSPPSAAVALEHVDGDPDDDRPRRAPAAAQARRRELLPLDAGGHLMSDIPKTLFLGLGTSVVAYYRCFLPAVALGADYAIWAGETPVADRRRLRRAPAEARGPVRLRRRRHPVRAAASTGSSSSASCRTPASRSSTRSTTTSTPRARTRRTR